MKRLLAFLAIASVLAFGQQTANMTAPTPNPAQNVSAYPVGTSGSGYACYWIVTNFVAGSVVQPVPGCSSTLNATLSGSNYQQLTWTAAVGFGITYDVLKTTTAAFPVQGATDALATGLTTTSYQDQGGSLSPYTIAQAPSPASGYCRVNNWDFTPFPAIECISNMIAFLSQVPLADGNLGLQAHGAGTNIGVELKGKGTGPLIWDGQKIADSTGAIPGLLYSIEANPSLAQVNAGFTLVAANAAQTLKVTHVLLTSVGGTTGACTGVLIEDTNSSPVVALTALAAALTSGTPVDETIGSVTPGAGFAPATLTAGKGIQIIKDGSTACTTATSYNVIVFYKVNS
jgi:hypothetical protein